MSIKNTFFLLAGLSLLSFSCKKNDAKGAPDMVFNDSTDTVSKVNIVNQYATKMNVDIYINIPGSNVLSNFLTHFEVPANDTIQLPTRLFDSLSYDRLTDIKVDCYNDDYTVSNWPELSTYAYSLEGPKLIHKKMDFYLSGITPGNKRTIIFKNGHEETKWTAVNAYAGRYIDSSSKINGNSIWSTLSANDKYKQITCYVQGLYKISSINAGGTHVDSIREMYSFIDLGNSISFQLIDTSYLPSNDNNYYFASHFSTGSKKQDGSPDTAALTIGNRVYVMVKQ